MTDSEKISVIKRFIPKNATERFSDDDLIGYLSIAEQEIINWFYTVAGLPDDPVMPLKYEQTQCMAAVVGLGLLGGVNETHHHENGTVRIFSYADMIDYIHAHVYPLARIT